ncbi:hypothetical protein TcasGA2_TC002303 [Tribolium castaneum]|uniref:Uncharacterized protein n=1 Tax=Tribolium castaneum TaxID=7070 RepID=D7EHS7_TRICA|nr:hypothetical protein TcasGA2_TC002303 [Tribolium castaneum]
MRDEVGQIMQYIFEDTRQAIMADGNVLPNSRIKQSEAKCKPLEIFEPKASSALCRSASTKRQSRLAVRSKITCKKNGSCRLSLPIGLADRYSEDAA